MFTMTKMSLKSVKILLSLMSIAFTMAVISTCP
jgi:hypothetical protein